jgi:phosphoserine phosphatase
VALGKTEGRDASAELNQVLARFVQQRVLTLHEHIRSLAASLETELARVAQELGIPSAPEAGEIAPALRETPVFEFERPLKLPRASFARLFGQAAARHRLAARLAAEIGAEWEQSLRTYFALLRSWCEHSIEQIRRRFDSFAEAYRAQAERALAGTQLTAEEERAIVSDLEALGKRVPGGARGVHSCNWKGAT